MNIYLNRFFCYITESTKNSACYARLKNYIYCVILLTHEMLLNAYLARKRAKCN